jgi:hypothetical protein
MRLRCVFMRAAGKVGFQSTVAETVQTEAHGQAKWGKPWRGLSWSEELSPRDPPERDGALPLDPVKRRRPLAGYASYYDGRTGCGTPVSTCRFPPTVAQRAQIKPGGQNKFVVSSASPYSPPSGLPTGAFLCSELWDRPIE